MKRKKLEPGEAVVSWEPGGNLNMACQCGKPFTVTSEHGMFCEDLHGEQEALAAMADAKALIKLFVPEGGE